MIFKRSKANKFVEKVDKGEYNYIDNQCLCGNKDLVLDTIITKKTDMDFISLPYFIKNCGSIRIKERLVSLLKATYSIGS